MRSQATLAVLLITAGGLIYAATHQSRSPSTMQTDEGRAESPARLARLAGPRFAAEGMDARVEHLLEGAMHDLPSHPDMNRFVCKLPAEVGPVPLLDAVDAYLRGLPASRHDPVLLRDLHRAARQGNWLAKVQVVLAQNDEGAADDVTAFRSITLMQWMQEQRLGALYAAVGNAAGAARARRARPAVRLSSLDIYAAMHHNYPSQYKVGRELLRNGDPQQAAVGRRMLDCAARALPVYRQMHESRTLAAR
jgi:hypothetical protein